MGWVARFLPFRGGASAPREPLPGGIPEEGAERKARFALESVSTVQLSAILRSRVVRLGILALGVAGLVSLRREPAEAGDVAAPAAPAPAKPVATVPVQPGTPGLAVSTAPGTTPRSPAPDTVA